jgi:hypothetical protein
MANHAHIATARPPHQQLPLPFHPQTATALIGAALIAYRINRRASQLAELRGLLTMAYALGAIDAAECDRLLSQLATDREVRHG